jgi:hypothetical protein
VEGCSLDAPGGLFAAWDELSAQARAQLGPDNAMRSSPLVCHSPHPSLRRVLQTEARWTEAPMPHAGEGASDAPAPAPAAAARAPGKRPPGLAPLLLPAAPGLRSPPLHPSASPDGGVAGAIFSPAARMAWGSSGSALSSDGNSDSLSARSAARSESLSRGSSLADDAAPTAAGGATAGGAGPDEPASCPPPTTPRRAPRTPVPSLPPAGAGSCSVAGSLSSEAGPNTGGGNDSDNSL